MLWVYAAVLCIAVWTFAGVHAAIDYRATLGSERARLQSVSLALGAEIEAMLAGGVGEALAAANELHGSGGIERSPQAQIADTLADMLTGGNYVRALFVATPNRLVLVSRTTRSAVPGSALPTLKIPWNSGDVWVGDPISDPSGSSDSLIPVARRIRSEAGSDAWAGALFAFGRLTEIYRQPVSASGVGVFRSDGFPLALVAAPQHRKLEEVSALRGIGSSAIFREATAHLPHGIVEGTNPYTGRVISAAFQSVRDYPVLVVATRERGALLTEWYLDVRDLFAMALALTFLVVVASFALDYFMRALRRRERHYRTLFDNAAFGAFVLEGDRFVEANHTTASMFGVSDARDLIGLAPWDLSPELQSDGQSSKRCAAERISTALAKGSETFEWIHKRLDDGLPFHATVDISSLQDEGETLTLAVVHDITERRRADDERERMVQELRELAGALVSLQDDERRRIGRDLHDATGQVLAALEMKLDRLVRTATPADSATVPLLGECAQLARQCSSEIRTASYLLHPPLLDEIGLSSALRWLADGLRMRSGLVIDLDLPQSMQRLPREHELALFRVAQEALTNVHRHSMSPSVSIRLHADLDTVALEVEDIGRGIVRPPGDAAAEILSAGVGLAGMRERMRQLGGTLTVRSGTDGTCVRASLAVRGSSSRSDTVSVA
jgi:PAS domain S-box-containing protein